MFKHLTHARNIEQATELAAYVRKAYPGTVLIVDYGSQVINRDTPASDHDLVIVMRKSQPHKKDILWKGRRASLNFITLADLAKDAKGAYAYYFISKLINPQNIIFEERSVYKQVQRIVGSFVMDFAEKTMDKGAYELHAFIDLFYATYGEMNIFYTAYMRPWDAKIKDRLHQHMASALLPFTNKGKVVIRNGYSTKAQRIAILRSMLMGWTSYGTKIRGKGTNWPQDYIERNLPKLLIKGTTGKHL